MLVPLERPENTIRFGEKEIQREVYLLKEKMRQIAVRKAIEDLKRMCRLKMDYIEDILEVYAEAIENKEMTEAEVKKIAANEINDYKSYDALRGILSRQNFWN